MEPKKKRLHGQPIKLSAGELDAVAPGGASPQENTLIDQPELGSGDGNTSDNPPVNPGDQDISMNGGGPGRTGTPFSFS